MIDPAVPGPQPIGGPGGWRAAVADEERRRHYHEADFDDADWAEVAVPGHWRSEPAFAADDGPLLYRRTFETAGPAAGGGPGDRDRRTWLVLDGVMYTSDVWLDGAYLGDTEGWFFPHAFEITEPATARSEHVLALEVACPPPADRRTKRAVTGVFQHWVQRDETWNPGGIWTAPRIETTGPVRIEHFRALCREATATSAVVALRAVLDAPEAGEVDLVTTVVPDGPAGSTRSTASTGSTGGADGSTEHHHRQPIAAGENQIEWTVTVDAPRLWWPWSLGDQPLYRLTCAAHLDGEDPDAGPSDTVERRLGMRTVTADNWIFSVNGERLFLKGSNQGPTRMALAEATDADLAGDVHQARQVGLDFLRLHGHISRSALYDAADEVGLLLWQDLPLQWGYARSVRKPARRQAREAVDLLAHHPSIFVWCGHNEPFTLDIGADSMADPQRRRRLAVKAAASTVLPTWNKTVLDHSIKRVLERCDGSRPVVAHSGVLPHVPRLDGTDTHTSFGWYHGQFRQFASFLAAWPRTARFVTAFGAQSVPDDAAFLHPERWPDLDWDEAAARFALQKSCFDDHVPPADFATFDDWVAATQRYQAELIRFHVETLRRLKYRPCGGFAQFSFADGYPAVTWAVLDAERRPKPALAALRDACRPVIVVADWLPEPLAPGQPFALDVHVVNDTRITLSDRLLTAHLSWRETQPHPRGHRGEDRRESRAAGHQGIEPAPGGDRGGDPSSDDPSGDGSHTWRWRGEVAADDVVRIGTIQAAAPRRGPAAVVVELELAGGDGPAITNRYQATVAGPG